MGDHVILRFPFDDPDNPEVVDVLANVPVHWNKYLKGIAKKQKNQGDILYPIYFIMTSIIPLSQ